MLTRIFSTLPRDEAETPVSPTRSNVQARVFSCQRECRTCKQGEEVCFLRGRTPEGWRWPLAGTG